MHYNFSNAKHTRFAGINNLNSFAVPASTSQFGTFPGKVVLKFIGNETINYHQAKTSCSIWVSSSFTRHIPNVLSNNSLRAIRRMQHFLSTTRY